MALVTLNELFAADYAGAICGFDFVNLETVKAIMAGAEELGTPVILMVTEGGVKYAGLDYIAALGKVAAEKGKVPVALHLDHCTDFDLIIQAIKAGFTSVMIDASHLPFAENLKLTKEVVRVAHAAGVSVEAELGRIGGKEDNIQVKTAEAFMTDPEEAVEFVTATKVDCLAVAVGPSHGIYKGEPNLNLALLKRLKSVLDIPLVLHGGSGLPDAVVKEVVAIGVRKFNVWTELAVAHTDTIRAVLKEEPTLYDPRSLFKPTVEAMKAVVKSKILLTQA
ncbi:MAG: class II fructose-bisphosphate aldolase [Firmicutes bacterium]|nr:class II fructose-bisphosphate aldolase [Bacillota bacterium]